MGGEFQNGTLADSGDVCIVKIVFEMCQSGFEDLMDEKWDKNLISKYQKLTFL